MKQKQYAIGEVKALQATEGSGEFEVILSMPTVDRDGEVIDANAFEPLPESIPFHAFHDFNDPVGRATPYYDGDTLKARGFFASTPRAQEIRTLVMDGVIGHTSVGFMPPERRDQNGVPHIVQGELLEGSFVSVPSNREAAVLVAKSMAADVKRGGRLLSAKSESDLRKVVALIGRILDQLDETTDPDKTADIDPEDRAAAPAAANPPADMSVAKVWASISEAQATLLLT